MAILNSNSTTIRLEGDQLDHVTSISFGIEDGVLPVSRTDVGASTEYIKGVKTSTISVDGFCDFTFNGNVNKLNEYYDERELLQVAIVTPTQHFEGDAYLTSLNFSGATDEIATFSLQLQCTGIFESVDTVEDGFLLLDDDTCFLLQDDDSSKIIIEERIRI